MALTPDQLRRFHEDGYLVLRQAVDRSRIDDALRAINHSLGYTGLPPEDLPSMRSQSYCNDVRDQPVITGLFNDSPLQAMLASAMGGGNVQSAGQAQIALRFPGHGGDKSEPRGHLDGVGSGNNGIAKGEFTRNFAALVTVLLSPLTGPLAGNFTVWPGSHRTAEAFFKSASIEELRRGQPKLDLPHPPVQITGEPGDVVISHHQLFHGAAPNRSPHIRYAAIFRIAHAQTRHIGTDAMTDIWREWPGVRDAVESAPA